MVTALKTKNGVCTDYYDILCSLTTQVKLLVTNTSEIQWDDDSFKTLVMDEDLKEMIMALVTNTLEPERSTDFFRGKGNGLVLLFHGYTPQRCNSSYHRADLQIRGPGTGKTLTAERYGMSALIGFYGDYSIDASVAEFARKPLYRVTCGDIGTQPDQVEMYLKSALNIGARWDCGMYTTMESKITGVSCLCYLLVVLMDEAEVFLQERTLNDLNRNALVAGESFREGGLEASLIPASVLACARILFRYSHFNQ